MNIENRKENNILILKPIDKNIEALNSREFKVKILDFINQGDKLIILNLANVEFMDSSGLGSLISVLKILANSQGRILICEAQTPVKKIFELTRLNQVFPFFSKEEEAMKELVK